MKLTVVGCGDAFGSGGRLQTCYRVETEAAGAFLIDCGATALIGHQRAGLDPSTIRTILISHLHGDHFGGLVWWLLHCVHIAKRTAPLDIAGPSGIEQRLRQAVEALFPGALAVPLPFEMRFTELRAGQRVEVGGLAVTPFEVSHPSGAPSHALRIEVDGRTLAFSGDTEWVESLVTCAQGADLFVCECYAFDRSPRYHMNWVKLSAELPRFGARKVMITHMSASMLVHQANARRAGVIVAEDGMVLEI